MESKEINNHIMICEDFLRRDTKEENEDFVYMASHFRGLLMMLDDFNNQSLSSKATIYLCGDIKKIHDNVIHNIRNKELVVIEDFSYNISEAFFKNMRLVHIKKNYNKNNSINMDYDVS